MTHFMFIGTDVSKVTMVQIHLIIGWLWLWIFLKSTIIPNVFTAKHNFIAYSEQAQGVRNKKKMQSSNINP